MEILFKCAALALLSCVSVLLIRRFNPEIAFAVSLATASVILLACISLLKELDDTMKGAERIFGSQPLQVRSILKCLGIATTSKLGAEMCRDASLSALATALETAGSLCAAAVVMPLILTLLTTIGGML